jgi:hypothetical protein
MELAFISGQTKTPETPIDNATVYRWTRITATESEDRIWEIVLYI